MITVTLTGGSEHGVILLIVLDCDASEASEASHLP